MLQFSYSFTSLGLKPEIVCTFTILNQLSEEYELDFILTSGIDRNHMRNSLHYAGMAVDFTWAGYDRAIGKNRGSYIASRLKARLGTNYDVCVENDHIHIEFQQKTPIN